MAPGRAVLVCSCMALAFTACFTDGGGGTGDASTTDAPPATGSSGADPDTTGTGATPTTTGATASEGSDTGVGAVDYMADIQPIWDTRCVAGCHIESGIAQTNGPILTAEKSYGELVDVPSKTVPGILQVDPGTPDSSYLWHKIMGTQANVGGLGLQMPQGGELSAEELATIEAWILAGAKP